MRIALAQIGTGSPIWFEISGAVFTLSLIPVANAMDGFATSHMMSEALMPEPALLAEYLGADLGLRQPAEIRLIVSSIQFAPEVHGGECWANMPHEQQRMMDVLKRTRAAGVIFLSGDRHWCEFSRMDGPTGYPLWDFTSSSMTQKHPRGTPTPNPGSGGRGPIRHKNSRPGRCQRTPLQDGHRRPRPDPSDSGQAGRERDTREGDDRQRTAPDDQCGDDTEEQPPRAQGEQHCRTHDSGGHAWQGPGRNGRSHAQRRRAQGHPQHHQSAQQTYK